MNNTRFPHAHEIDRPHEIKRQFLGPAERKKGQRINNDKPKKMLVTYALKKIREEKNQMKR